MKKVFVKYMIEFFVIVVGISVSFWFDRYQVSLDNIDREKEVVSELATELDLIQLSVENRESAFTFDFENLTMILNDSLNNVNFNYPELLIATTDYRGFSPSEEIYTSLKYDGGLKFIRFNSIKIAIESLYNGTKYGVIANMEDEIIVQRDVLKYIQYNYPKLLVDIEKMRISELEKISIFTDIVQKDKTLKSLLTSKLRFMKNKLRFLQDYKNSLFELKKLVRTSY
ncbi:MAG: hypothetical protein P8H38_09605 [Flavobacteriaceae bacterium]|nr:hypothetical protein [Flavobacteriaceae bacterium]